MLRVCKRCLTGPVDSVLLQMPRALMASCFTALMDVGVLVVLVEAFGWTPVSAALAGYGVGLVLQYILCTYWVFPRSQEGHLHNFLLFTLFSMVGLIITWAVFVHLGRWGVPYLMAKAISLILGFGWNFSSRKWLLARSSDANLRTSAAM